RRHTRSYGDWSSDVCSSDLDFHMPDDLLIRPRTVAVFPGQPGGPFSPEQQAYTVTNLGSDTIVWSVTKNSSWLSLSNDSGTLPEIGRASCRERVETAGGAGS